MGNDWSKEIISDWDQNEEDEEWKELMSNWVEDVIYKEEIEKSISNFSGIDFELNDWETINNEDGTTYLININIRNVKEIYVLDTKTFEVLDQVEELKEEELNKGQ